MKTKKRPFSYRLKRASVPLIPGGLVQVWLVFGLRSMTELLPGRAWVAFCGIFMTSLVLFSAFVLWDVLRGYRPSEVPDGSHENM